MRVWLVATLVMAQASAAFAQTAPPAEEAPPPATACADFPPPPTTVDHLRVNPTQMSAASARQREWREWMTEVIECRRLSNNASIAHFNDVNSAWSAQLDAFCARRDIRCTPQDREAAQ